METKGVCLIYCENVFVQISEKNKKNAHKDTHITACTHTHSTHAQNVHYTRKTHSTQ